MLSSTGAPLGKIILLREFEWEEQRMMSEGKHFRLTGLKSLNSWPASGLSWGVCGCFLTSSGVISTRSSWGLGRSERNFCTQTSHFSNSEASWLKEDPAKRASAIMISLHCSTDLDSLSPRVTCPVWHGCAYKNVCVHSKYLCAI